MHYISRPNVFFTSDYHLYHERILMLGKGRPFSCVEEMHAAIVDRHNAVVRPGDKVYNLGDFALRCTPDMAYAQRQRLMGEQYFFFGNHDKIAWEMIREHPDCFIKYWGDPDSPGSHVLRLKGYGDIAQKITIGHFKQHTFTGSHKGNWNLYGHSHGQLPEEARWLSFDVGVDCWDFTPVSIEQVAQKMKSMIPAWEKWRATLPEGRME
jgi:calcineurin-like phosphoesterase family protein